jgi:hypothetical protein
MAESWLDLDLLDVLLDDEDEEEEDADEEETLSIVGSFWCRKF